MLNVENNGYYPLTAECVDKYVPSRPGIYMLAIQLANGVRQNFCTTQSENLYRSLQRLVDGDTCGLPTEIHEHMTRFQCYFTYYIILKAGLRREVEKMLSQTSDPVTRLRVVNDN